MSNRVFSNQLLEGARNCILSCGKVERGMNVLILNLINDPANPVDEMAVHALATVAQEAGATVQILWTTGMEKGWWSDVPAIVLGAFGAADLVINNTMAIGRPVKAVRELMFSKGISMIRNMATTAGVLGSEWARFPYELSDEITRRVGERFDKASTWRVVDPNGTDITGKIGRPSETQSGFSSYGIHRGTKRNRPFPQGNHVPVTSRDATGIVVSDRTLPLEARHIGVPERKFSQPVKVTVENNRMMNIEGGAEAGAYRRFYESLVPYLGEDVWNVSSFHAGINPKSKVYEAAEKNPDLYNWGQHNHPSVMHFHLGGSKEVVGYDYPYMWHLSNEIDHSTIYLDGEKLYDSGHLTVLDDPSLRKFSSRFGDPDTLLREVTLHG
jgi:hypothetical protein